MRRYIRCELFRQIYSVQAWCCGVVARFLPILVAADCVCLFPVDLTLVLSEFWVRVLLDFIWSFGIPIDDFSSLRIRRFLLRFTLCRCTCFRLTLEVCRFNSVKGDRFHLAFYHDFYDSDDSYDDLIWAVVRGGQRRCNCDLSQKYMWACVNFLI